VVSVEYNFKKILIFGRISFCYLPKRKNVEPEEGARRLLAVHWVMGLAPLVWPLAVVLCHA